MLIDTHAHLFWDSYKPDLDQVIQRSLVAGVTTIINVGVDVEKSEIAAKLESDQIEFYSTIGIHPHEALRHTQGKLASTESIHQDIDKLEEIYLKNPSKVVAVGECGLDFLFESNPDFIPSSLSLNQVKSLQRKLFQAQIDLAKKLNLPLIVHCRDDRSKNPQNSQAWEEVIEMTKDWYGIYHCYSGLQSTTHNLPPNFLISFAGNLTYPKNDYLREAAKILPLEKICLETDSPFLSPQSKRGERNEPSSVLEIAQLVAEIKGVSLEEVAHQTFTNVKSLLKLG